MRAFYDEYFYIPKHGKIREKVMMLRVALTVIFMVACLAAMSFMAYAYFSSDVSTGVNDIKAASFDLSVSVTKEGASDAETVNSADDKTYTYVLVKGKYVIELKPADSSTTKNGFCVITVIDSNENSIVYHTQQLGADQAAVGGKRESIQFTLELGEAAKVKFQAHWGTSSYYSYKNDSQFYINDAVSVFTVNNGNNGNSTKKDNGGSTNTTNTTNANNATNTTNATNANNATSATNATNANNATSATNATNANNTNNASIVNNGNDGILYTVKTGDSLLTIAKQYDTTVERIAAYNDLTEPDNIQDGQQIKIPPADWVIPGSTVHN